MRYAALVIKVCLLAYYYLAKPTTTELVIYLKKPSRKTKTAVCAIKTDRNRNRTGNLKPHRPSMYVYMYVCIYVCMHVCMYVCMYVCMNVCM